jgi:hypothetical protein
MIRCIPVDGSAPFEVHCITNIFGCASTVGELAYAQEQRTALVYAPSRQWVGCRIESWRERAERLEKELEALRRQNALDAIDKRRESEHG